MASNEQIQQAIQASANAGVASGYAQALEDVVGNLDAMISSLEVAWEQDQSAPIAAAVTFESSAKSQVETAKAIRAQIAPELERRRTNAERELKFASVTAQLTSAHNWKVSALRQAIDALRLRPLLVAALGGAAPPKPGP